MNVKPEELHFTGKGTRSLARWSTIEFLFFRIWWKFLAKTNKQKQRIINGDLNKRFLETYQIGVRIIGIEFENASLIAGIIANFAISVVHALRDSYTSTQSGCSIFAS